MPEGAPTVITEYLRRVSAPPHAAADAALLAAYARSRDERAFAELVHRHGPMVLGVCRRFLGPTPDADDAFQAAFLALARSARRVRSSVPGWLYRVAVRASRAALRREPSTPAPAEIADRTDPFAAVEWRDVRRALDEELGRLPDRWRAPLVLSYLEGLSRDEAARRLGWSLRTFHRRLDEARDALRRRLQRRGLGATVLAAAVLPGTGLRAEVPATLGRQSVAVATGRSAAPHAVRALVPRTSGGFAVKAVLSALMLAGGTFFMLGGYQPAGADPVPDKAAPPVVLAMAPVKKARPPEDPLAKEVRAAQEKAIAYLRKAQSAAPHSVRALVPRTSGGFAVKAVLSALALASGTLFMLGGHQPAGADPVRDKPAPPMVLAMAPVKKGRPPEDPLAKEVRAAQEKAIAYLRKAQSADGHWEQPAANPLMKAGGTALAVLALLEAGLKADDETVERGLKYLRAVEPKDVYVVSLQTQVFCRANQKEDAERIRRNVKWLEEAAIYDRGGLTGWTYTNAAGRADNSNSRYAVAALHAADRAGFKVAKAGFWKDVRDMYVGSQKATGGWGYVPESPRETHTMTVSGVLCLTLAKDVLGKADDATDAAIKKGFEWIASEFQLQAPHGAYNLDVIAALGRASDRRTFGDKDRKREWFREGAELLLKNQTDDGRFALPGAIETMPVVSTAFGLRFLSSRPD